MQQNMIQAWVSQLVGQLPVLLALLLMLIMSLVLWGRYPKPCLLGFLGSLLLLATALVYPLLGTYIIESRWLAASSATLGEKLMVLGLVSNCATWRGVCPTHRRGIRRSNPAGGRRVPGVGPATQPYGGSGPVPAQRARLSSQRGAFRISRVAAPVEASEDITIPSDELPKGATTGPFRACLRERACSAVARGLCRGPGRGTAPGPTASPTPKGAGPATRAGARRDDDRAARSRVRGWDGAWVVYRYSPDKREWLTWKSPETPLPRKGFPAVGPQAAVVIDPDARYSGWLFDLETHKWTQVPESPLVRDLAMDPIVVAFVGDRLVVWGYTRPPLHGAVLNLKTMKWAPMAEARHQAAVLRPYGVIGKKVVIGGNFNDLQDGAVYDVERDAWEQMPAAPVHFTGGIARDVWRDRFVIFGGGEGRRAAAPDDPAGRTGQQMPAGTAGGRRRIRLHGQRRQAVPLVRRQDRSGERCGVRPGEEGVEKDRPVRPAPRQRSFAHAAGNRVTVWGRVSDTPARFFRDVAVYDLEQRTAGRSSPTCRRTSRTRCTPGGETRQGALPAQPVAPSAAWTPWSLFDGATQWATSLTERVGVVHRHRDAGGLQHRRRRWRRRRWPSPAPSARRSGSATISQGDGLARPAVHDLDQLAGRSGRRADRAGSSYEHRLQPRRSSAARRAASAW